MNLRPLLIATFTLGSAFLGASLAVRMNPHRPLIPVGSLPQSLPTQVDGQPLPTVSPSPVVSPTPQATATPPDEFDQIKIQLRRAIRDRNLVLLRSLMQAGSVREALRSVGAEESTNFENFDQSTWTMLEKALNYRCRQSSDQPEPGICFERQSPQPLP
jgi:hypothetical protein